VDVERPVAGPGKFPPSCHPEALAESWYAPVSSTLAVNAVEEICLAETQELPAAKTAKKRRRE
jgi:hypothetical protein